MRSLLYIDYITSQGIKRRPEYSCVAQNFRFTYNTCKWNKWLWSLSYPRVSGKNRELKILLHYLILLYRNELLRKVFWKPICHRLTICISKTLIVACIKLRRRLLNSVLPGTMFRGRIFRFDRKKRGDNWALSWAAAHNLASTLKLPSCVLFNSSAYLGDSGISARCYGSIQLLWVFLLIQETYTTPRSWRIMA